MKTYEGIRDPVEPNTAGECIVMVNGQVLPLEPSLRVRRHSPTGFSWGYGGSGPAQLALAILLDYFNGDAELAHRYYQQFKWDFVAQWSPAKDWKITDEQIGSWLSRTSKSMNR